MLIHNKKPVLFKTYKQLAAALLVAIFAIGAVTAQDTNDAEKEEFKITGGSTYDDRFRVKNFSFWRRLVPSGKGEILEIFFDIENKTDREIPLRLFLLGFYEQDLRDKEFRSLFSYPSWRKRDFEKEQHEILFLDSIPKVDQKKFAEWQKARQQDKVETRNEETKADEKTEDNKTDSETTESEEAKKYRDHYLSFLEYVNYLESHANEGVEFKLQGMENVSREVATGENIRVVMGAMKSSVFTELYSRYRSDQKFFNHLGLVLFDTEKQEVVYRQFFKFKKKLRIY